MYKVEDRFNCGYNDLEDLNGCPEYVGESFHCSGNKLKSLEGIPKFVGGNFWLKYNRGKKFTEKEIRAVCYVIGKVYV